MCGINGLLNFKDAGRFITLMNDSVRHRGPDAQGCWSDDFLTLGHRRLSIIDLSEAANQPFVKDNLSIVYNGEIYNFLQLKEELKSRGVVFRTKSDTEVVIELFRQQREGSFTRLRGMFAFCIYDMKTGELFLVRDYFGIKPLYYSFFDNNRLAFSSELKSFLNLPEFKKEINIKSLVSSLNYLWVYGSGSIFKNVEKIPPAHYLYLRDRRDLSTARMRRYWELNVSRSELGEEELVVRLRKVMEDSVSRHLISDVPIGAFLSGGLDSSLICAMVGKINSDISSYTISVGRKDQQVEKMPDDNIYARKVANFLNTKHTDIRIFPSIIDSLKEMVYALDEPIGDPAAINTYLICQLACQHGVKVLLSGMGADELFGGYRRQSAVLLAQRFKKMPGLLKNSAEYLIRRLPVRMGRHGIKSFRWAKRFAGFAYMPIDMAYMRSYSYYDKGELNLLFDHQYDTVIDEIYEEHKDLFHKMKNFDNINKMCYTDINMFMTGLNLSYTDRASMAASVEVRVPFIDREVVEFAMSVPGRYKINGGVSKYILKKAAADYLPKNIIHRPKASFGMPIRAWISGELKGLIDDLLSEKDIKKRAIFDPLLVRKIIEDDRAGKEDNAYRIYQFLTLELWLRRYLDQ